MNNMINLLHGDCLELMKTIESGSVDLILTDPPYGITSCKWDSVIPFEPMWNELNRIIKPNGLIVFFSSQPFTSTLICSNINNFMYEWIWEKNNSSNFQKVKTHPLKKHETIIVFKSEKYKNIFSEIIKEQMQKQNISYNTISSTNLSKNGNKTGWLYNKIKGSQHPSFKQWEMICKIFNIDNKYYEMKLTYNLELKNINKVNSNKKKSGNINHFKSSNEFYIQNKTGYPNTVIKMNTERGLHPTQKPVALLEYLIKTYTNENELVLDFTMGSGSTGIACKNLNRRFIGIEKDDKYFEIAKNRINNHISPLL